LIVNGTPFAENKANSFGFVKIYSLSVSISFWRAKNFMKPEIRFLKKSDFFENLDKNCSVYYWFKTIEKKNPNGNRFQNVIQTYQD